MVQKKFDRVPYLNSSLFEPERAEHSGIFIGNLDDDKTLPIYSSTVLKDSHGKRLKGELSPLEYLFRFLESYDFSSEGSEEIQEENKTLINASVLGLIFEKINGYKDGSFFTPGFITMYMSRETIRKAVIQKFNEVKNWNCTTISDLYNQIDDIQEANEIVNSVKICDPAVGSGHFLVSSLNEMIAVKNDLRILQDRQGRRLKEYHVEVQNDELIITDEDGDLFEYHPRHRESQRVQEALFHEKQTIIENCLFGVDINSNSVKICRLRLWIELLKNAYYYEKPGMNVKQYLQTLPNIDINIKTGNSLISRFALDSDLREALRKSKWNIDSYRIAVSTYRRARSRDEKREMEELIDTIKSDFRSEISRNDPKVRRLQRLSGELFQMTSQGQLFSMEGKEKKAWEKKVKDLTKKVDRLEAEIQEIENNKIYENAFEWRFEFPEVLDDDGNYVGFDAVIANPPYFSISQDPQLVQVRNEYKTFNRTGDIYSLFIEKSQDILREKGYATLIISNKWLRANYGEELRKYLVNHTHPILLIDFGQNLLFESAIVHTNILTIKKEENQKDLSAVRFPDRFFDNSTHEFEAYINENIIYNLPVSQEIWNIIPLSFSKIQFKIEEKFNRLKDWKIDFYRGILTGYNKAFIIEKETKDELISADPNSETIIKPILRGRDTRRYYCNFSNLWLINSHNGYADQKRINVIEDFPAIYEHLLNFEDKASKRYDQGNHWTNLRNCAYLDKFDSPKIIFSEIVSEPQFYYDEKGYYPEATVFFISGEKLKYLTAVLNSKAATFFFKNFYMGGELVGKIRYKKAFLEQLPIPKPNNTQEENIIAFVDNIIGMKEENPKCDTSDLESRIDQLVYELYELTEEEIEIVEQSS